MMKQFFWTATAALWLAAAPAQAQSTLDKYLAKNSQSTGAAANQKNDAGINKVFKSAEGYWRLDDTRATGGFCAITYVAGPYSAGYIGASVQGPESFILFTGPTIAPIKKTKRKKMTLTAASDGQISTVPALHMPNLKDSGVIMFRLTNIQEAVDMISDVEEIGVEMDKKVAFSIKWKGGLTARKAMNKCIGSGAKQGAAK